MIADTKEPKITYMGEAVAPGEFTTDENNPVDLADTFKPVAISPKAIDTASRIVSQEYFKVEGVYTFLKKRAEFIFSKMTVFQKSARLKGLIYHFAYEANGPVLKNVELYQE